MSSDHSLIKTIQSVTEAHRWQMPAINIFFNIPHQPKYYHGTNDTEIPSHKSIFTHKLQNLEPCAIHKVSARRTLVFTPNLTEFDRCRRYLTAHNYDFYTTTPKQRKHRVLVLHDLNRGTTVDQVIDALIAHPLILPRNSQVRLQTVVEYHPNRSSRRELRRPLFLVVLKAHSAFVDLMRVEDLLDGQKCRWSVFRRSSIRWPLTPAVQCHRCQRLGHVSKNCNMSYRCVKCADQHAIGKCQVPLTTPRNRLYCVLCRKKGHPASYAGCPQRLKMARKRMRRMAKLAAGQRKVEDSYATLCKTDVAKDDLIDLDSEEEQDAADGTIQIEDSCTEIDDAAELSIDIEQIVDTLQRAKIRMSRAADVKE